MHISKQTEFLRILVKTTCSLLFFVALPANADKALIQIADDAAKAYKIRPTLLKAVCHVESAWKANAIGDDGESIGVCQIQIATGQSYFGKKRGRSEIRRWLLNPNINIFVAAHLLKSYLNEFDGNEGLAIIAYNAGPHAKVLRHYRKVKQAMKSY